MQMHHAPSTMLVPMSSVDNDYTTYCFPDRVDGGAEVTVPRDRGSEGEDREASGGRAQSQEPDLLRGHQVILLPFHLNLFPIIIQSELRGRGGRHCRLHLLNT